MYMYDQQDGALLDQRIGQFGDQVRRRLDGLLSEDEFRPLRLMNGLYQELHAYMLRVAIPYGTLSSRQLRKLAYIARTHDKGYGHFTTRQNIQFNWVALDGMTEILADLASVDMHAIQTSGSCIRNVTADHFAGAAVDEVEDPRIWAEIIRQWSTLHPEFLFLPRKFKIAVTGSPLDRAITAVHDIGLKLHRNSAGEVGFEVLVGGGLGRIPMIGKVIRRFLPKPQLLPYLESILRVYNQFGRRDNKYKARIKILVHDLGAEAFTRLVEEEWRQIRDTALALPASEVARIKSHFNPPPFESLPSISMVFEKRRKADPIFDGWAATNVAPHKISGYGIVTISLKSVGKAPGDATSRQMDAVAGLAERYGFGEIRVTREQNLVLPHVKLDNLPQLWEALGEQELSTANIGLATDIVSCPGLDFCSLASARAIPIAQQIAQRFADLERQHHIGELRIKISGCINACGHHHLGHIGIRGVDRNGEELYQVSIGGNADGSGALGQIVGPAFTADAIVEAVNTLILTYLTLRAGEERFIDTVSRLGISPFKEQLYASD